MLSAKCVMERVAGMSKEVEEYSVCSGCKKPPLECWCKESVMVKMQRERLDQLCLDKQKLKVDLATCVSALEKIADENIMDTNIIVEVWNRQTIAREALAKVKR